MLLGELRRLRDPQQRLQYIVERGRRQKPFDETRRVETNRVEGCLSKLWFLAWTSERRCHFQTDSDSAIVKGIAAVLCEFYSGQAPDEILRHDPSFLAEAGITQHLSANRRNALSRLWEKIRAFAEKESRIN